jgi:hypothetical protein
MNKPKYKVGDIVVDRLGKGTPYRIVEIGVNDYKVS